MEKNVSYELCEERREFILSKLDFIVKNFENAVKTIEKNNDNQMQIINNIEKETDKNTNKVIIVDEKLGNQEKSMNKIDFKVNWIIGLYISSMVAVGLSVFRYFLNK